MIEMRKGISHPIPGFISWPESTDEVSSLLRWAQKERVPVTPLGGETGVCGAYIPVKGGVILDTKRMNRIIFIYRVFNTITAQPGIIGENLAESLQSERFTLGHFPSSMYCSTLGGWLATRSAGQLLFKYGKIQEILLSIEAVMADGKVIRTLKTPRSSTEPSLIQLLIGPEGKLCIFTMEF